MTPTGCGVVVLKPLEAARRDGDHVLAVLRGSAVNSDGRSNGLTAPNPGAQEALLRDAYRRAGVDPTGVDYVEAHGTGTLLGDPIEAAALAATLGAGRPTDAPLLIGSVKSNLGHLEGAAGVVGLIKVVLALHHDALPASLGYRAPNPLIDFASGHLEVVTATRAWPRRGDRARAGVSAFGFGGTNAHVVVEEAPPIAVVAGGEPAVTTFLLSASDELRLRADAAGLADWMEEPGRRLPARRDMAHTLAARRRRGRVRAAVSGRSHRDLALALRALSTGARVAGVSVPVDTRTCAAAGAPGAVWIFSGYGSQWPGMGRDLLEGEASFRGAVDRLDEDFRREVGFALSDALEEEADPSDVERAQLLLFGVQVALASMWQAHGLAPAAVVGHSAGEVAAAVVAGVLSRRDGLRVMALRSRLLQSVNAVGGGAMAVVGMSPAELDEMRPEWPQVEVAVYASPTQCTVAGPADQVQALVARAESLGRNAWVLDVTGAGHSSAVDPVLDALEQGLSDLRVHDPAVRFYSTVLGASAGSGIGDAAYWRRNLRQAVRFEPALAAAAADGFRVFVEVSPHPVAGAPTRETLAYHGAPDALVVGTLVRRADEDVAFRAQLARLHQAGVIDVGPELAPRAGHAVLPTTSWQRRHFWVSPAPVPKVQGGHPLLGFAVEDPVTGRHLWRAELDPSTHPSSIDRLAGGMDVLSSTGLTAVVLAATAEVGDEGQTVVRDLALRDAVDASADLGGQAEITTVLEVRDGADRHIEVYGRRAADAPWEPLGSGRALGGSDLPGTPDDLAGPTGAPTGPQPVLGERAISVAGVESVPALLARSLDVLAAAADQVRPVGSEGNAGNDAPIPEAISPDAASPQAASYRYRPVAIGELRLVDRAPGLRRGTATIVASAGGGIEGGLRIEDPSGRLLLEATGIRLEPTRFADRPVGSADDPSTGTASPDDAGAAGRKRDEVVALATASPDAGVALRFVTERIVDHLASVMGYRPEAIDRVAPLSSLGIDSLMATRARNLIEHDFAVAVPARLLLQGGSTADLAAHLTLELGLGTDGSAPTGPLDGAAGTRGAAGGPRLEGRDSTERWIAAIWADVLGVGIGVLDPFAAVGGDAASAQAITTAVRNRLGTAVDEAALFALPATIEQQAELLRPVIEGERASPLRPLRTSGTERPLFLFHPAGGSTAVYEPLTGVLPADVPVYGLDRLDGPRDVGTRAEHYVQLILGVQSRGPYRLGGWSLGGCFAYEVAGRLVALGHEVDLVALIDTVLLRRQAGEDQREVLRQRYERFFGYLGETYGIDVAVPIDDLLDDDDDQQVAVMAEAIAAAGLALSPGILEHQRLSYLDARMAESYRPEPYAGRVVLFRATTAGLTAVLDPRYARDDPAAGWDDLCSDLEIIRVAGDHTSIIDPPAVDHIATELARCLRDVPARTGATAT
jgi:thioesterase domain-containing protein/malonyl CoA-acyl carrier protein transacylase/acyl carrier protein